MRQSGWRSGIFHRAGEHVMKLCDKYPYPRWLSLHETECVNPLYQREARAAEPPSPYQVQTFSSQPHQDEEEEAYMWKALMKMERRWDLRATLYVMSCLLLLYPGTVPVARLFQKGSCC
ncbi:unnamed protein product [Pleuronectes platessa]|uniref:Uncharacterized protein n=1 Tax=Pleuronectes platessa TaxID=8262 RepID=A0A9N7VGH4_PLEPL|nr:unnamed protein product [Pleuronectes platessa]